MRLEDIDTSKLRYNPKDKKFRDKLLKDIPEFKDYGRPYKLKAEMVFPYISILYDPNSPMQYEILDYYDKKREVAEMLDFPKKEDGYWEDYIEEMLLGQNMKVNALIATFVSSFGMPEYTQLVAYREMLIHETSNALNPKNTKNKDTLANIEKLTQKLKEVNSILFQSGKVDEVEAARRALYAQVEKSRIKIRPEEIVQIIEDTQMLPKEFDQYLKKNKEGKREKKQVPLQEQVLKMYKETKQEREKRKKDEEDAKK